MNLYASNEADIDIGNQTIRLNQETRYPWDGHVRLTIHPARESERFELCLRIPGWVRGQPLAGNLYRYLNDQPAEVALRLNGEKVVVVPDKGFVRIRREWQSGDTVELDLPMVIRRIVAHDSVKADVGRVALERGPLVFCAEWPDNKGGHVRNLLLPDDSPLTSEYRDNLLKGIRVIRGNSVGYKVEKDNKAPKKTEQDFTAIPYYAWAHRGKGEMAVWLARDESAVRPVGLPTLASNSHVTASFGKNPKAVNDQLEPASSIDHEVPFFHWWPHKGTTEWIQYDFEKFEEVSSAEVYWFDDTGMGECRVPESWRILYPDNGMWRPVYSTDAYGIEKDRYNKIIFETVRTKSLRLEIRSQDGWAGGIHEWKVK